MITTYKQRENAGLVTVTVTSDLVGTVYYHWWRDGDYCGMTRVPRMTFYVDYLGQAAITVVDTTDPDYDHAAGSPAVHRASRALYWTASTDPCAYYLVEEQESGGAWVEIARVEAVPGQWEYTLQTERLTDLATYSWRVTPMSPAGQAGPPTVLGPEVVVRVPDAPRFNITFNAGTARVTFAEDA